MKALGSMVPSLAIYINFKDSNIVAATAWEQAYFGAALGTLQCVNAK